MPPCSGLYGHFVEFSFMQMWQETNFYLWQAASHRLRSHRLFIGYFFKILNSSLVTAVGSLQIKLVIYKMPKVPKLTHFSLFFASSREEIVLMDNVHVHYDWCLNFLLKKLGILTTRVKIDNFHPYHLPCS